MKLGLVKKTATRYVWPCPFSSWEESPSLHSKNAHTIHLAKATWWDPQLAKYICSTGTMNCHHITITVIVVVGSGGDRCSQ